MALRNNLKIIKLELRNLTNITKTRIMASRHIITINPMMMIREMTMSNPINTTNTNLIIKGEIMEVTMEKSKRYTTIIMKALLIEPNKMKVHLSSKT